MTPLLLALIGRAAAGSIVLYDLESDDGGFVESGETGEWEWGVVRHGPGAGFDGSHAWSTGLTRDYLNDSIDYLEIPLPDLTGITHPTLSFEQWYDIAVGDYAWVEADTGNGWEVATPLYGYPYLSGFSGVSGGWHEAAFDLTTLGLTPRVRLAFAADLTGVSAGWTIDNVGVYDGDVAPPQLTALTALADTEDLTGPYVVQVTAEDDTQVAGVTLAWSAGGDEVTASMDQVSPGLWQGDIPAQAPDTVVRYHVVGSDGLNSSRAPESEEESFRVYLPAPTGLTGPTGRVVATSTTLAWTPPVSIHPVLGYDVVHAGATIATVTDPTADVPLQGGVESFTVRAVYAEGPGDLSDEVSVDGVLPVLTALDPASAWPGDTVRVHLAGEYLLLVDGDVSLALGDGIAVGTVDVRDVDDATVSVVVASDATPGLRDATLQSGGVSVTLPDAFSVLEGDDRPRLLGLSPDSVRQGDEGDLAITFVGTLDSLPSVDLGDGLIVESVDQPEDDTVRVHYAVTGAAPLGEHPVTVDDGVRLFEGVSLEVNDQIAPPAGGCGTPLIPALIPALLALGGVVSRRR